MRCNVVIYYVTISYVLLHTHSCVGTYQGYSDLAQPAQSEPWKQIPPYHVRIRWHCLLNATCLARPRSLLKLLCVMDHHRVPHYWPR